ncbi:hypothetical protein ACWERV_32480 [Streptomyces sp. NPDC004031]
MGRTELAPEQLPESFEHATRLDIAGESWDVVRADPPTAPEFVAGGSLVLTLSRVQVAAPEGVKYSLPTVYDALPPTVPAQAGSGGLFLIHEDDWRQTEMVSRQVAGEAETEAELRAIRRIHQEHSRLVGHGDSSLRAFDMIHIRRAPAAPLAADVSRRRLSELLPGVSTPYTGVSYDGGRSRVAGSFAVDAGPFTLYGRAQGDQVTVLCLTPSASTVGPDAAAGPTSALGQAMGEFGLVLIDWCGASVRDSSEIGDFLM